MSYGKNDIVDIATKLGRLANGGVVGYYAGGKTSEIMSKTIPDKLVNIVEKHKKIQLGASLAQSFIPGAGVAATVASAIFTNLSSAAAKGVATVFSEGVKVIPVVGWLASAGISTVTTTAIIYGAAYLYMNALTKMYSVKGKFDLNYLNSVINK